RELSKPDLIIEPMDIEFSNNAPTELQNVRMTANIHHVGISEIGPVLVEFFDGDPYSGGTLIGNRTYSTVSPGEMVTAYIDWQAISGMHDIYVKVGLPNFTYESDETNNMAFEPIFVSPIKQLSALERLLIGAEKSSIVFSAMLFLAMLCLGLFVSKLIFKL
ncbi:MAG: CARDB domain-containing protein, partial [Candidatus Hydrothermarchaeota archaeon]|nr:CARDB domain-containing protein [Candidatus Hydrothermarchaeota archaeon]